MCSGEIIEDGKNVFLVKLDNLNWYEVLKKVLSLQEKFSNIGKSARDTVQERYSFSANAERFAKYLNKK